MHPTLETWRRAARKAHAEGEFPDTALDAVLSVVDSFEGDRRACSATELRLEAQRRAARGSWTMEASRLLVGAERTLVES